MYAGTTVYDDSDADQIEGIAPTASHRDVDLAVTAADAEGVDIHIYASQLNVLADSL
jgi:hypothetical protein